MLDSQPVSVPSPKTDWKTAPDKVDLGPRPSQVQQERGTPAPDKVNIDMNPLQQPAYGVNPHLVPAGEEK